MDLNDYSLLNQYNKKPIDELRDLVNYRGFIWACGEGNIDLLKWMIKINPNIEIAGTEWDREFPFKVICAHGYLEIAKWFITIHPTLNLSVDSDDPFRYACREGQLELAKWLLEKKPDIDLSCCFEAPFRNACRNGHINIAKWLLNKKPDINTTWAHDDAFRTACDNNHIDLAEWLCTIRQEYNIWVDNDLIVGYSILEKPLFYYNSYIKEETEHECCICYETSNIKTNCGHYGCEECFIKLKSNICPYCRQNITQYNRIIS